MNIAYNILYSNDRFPARVSALFLAAGLAVASMGCSGQRFVRMAKKAEIAVQPNPLEAHGRKAKADVTISVPPAIITGKYTYAVEFTYTPLDGPNQKPVLVKRIPFIPGEYVRTKDKLTAAKTLDIPWEPGQGNGVLKVRSVLNVNRSYTYLPYQTVAQGMITTYQLAVPEEPIGYIVSPFTRKEEQNSYVFYFDHNSPRLKAYTGGDSGPLADFIAQNNTSKHVVITAYHTPDEAAGTARARAESLREFYSGQVDRHTYRNEAKAIKFDLNVVGSDMNQLLKEVRKSPMPQEDKAPVLAILEGTGNDKAKLQKLRRLSQYQYLQHYIFPSLRKATMEAKYVRPEKMNFEIGLTADRIARGAVNEDQLSAEELSYAAELTPILDEKEKIYKAAHHIHQRPEDAYNLGVLFLEKARKTTSHQTKMDLYASAVMRFRQAAGAINTPQVYYNLATAYFLLGNYQAANEYYDITARLRDDPEFVNKVKSARAAMLIQAGQYEQAATVLETAGEDYSANISRGLLGLYFEQPVEAAAAFTQAAALDPERGLPYYLLAVTGARSDNEELLFTSLQQAVAKDRELVQKAVADLEFRHHRHKAGFRKALK